MTDTIAEERIRLARQDCAESVDILLRLLGHLSDAERATLMWGAIGGPNAELLMESSSVVALARIMLERNNRRRAER